MPLVSQDRTGGRAAESLSFTRRIFHAKAAAKLNALFPKSVLTQGTDDTNIEN